jgi:uncharacterized protein YndB with AHSA1/START domain
VRNTSQIVLKAPVEDVWRFVGEPYHLSDWWPNIAGVLPDRRGMAAGARWKIMGPSYVRREATQATLVVHAVVPRERFAFELVKDGINADVLLEPVAADRTRVTVTVEGRWVLGTRRTIAKKAAHRLYDLVQTGADL